MKCFIILIALFSANLIFSQLNFPDFLQGTWKMEQKEIYEHWDKLNPSSLKGFSYKTKDGIQVVSEYLDIIRKNDETIYTATVIRQNEGRGIEFRLTESDSIFTFENAAHDFPKKIVYKKLSDTEIFVQVSDGKEKGFSYKMIKQPADKAEKDSTIANPHYDRKLAADLSADDYGMRSYIFVILKTGTNTTADKALIAESFRGHLNNINHLVEQNKLVVAGPLGKNENNYRGIFILSNVNTLEEAKELLQTDPAIKNGLLDAELFNWYGSAALPAYLPVSEKIWKQKP